MRRSILLATAALLSCVTNPYTGRSQLDLIGEETELAMGIQGYQQLLAQAAVSTNPAIVNPVIEIGRVIARAADRPGYEWEFNVIEDDKTINAFCLPGGKVAVYTGIFPVAENEAGLAIIIGHEVSHALARHGAERVSQGLLAQLGGVLLGAALSQADPQAQQAVLAAYGISVNVGAILPFSRSHESEADRLGLMLAARAGYDPREGPNVWRRMARLAGSGGPEFLSTHPSHDTRISDMEQWMPEALTLYEASVKRPNRKLPGIGSRSALPSAMTVRGQGEWQRGKTPQGQHAVQFGFALSEDVWLESIAVDVPGRGKVPIKADLSVKKGITKQFTIWNQAASDPPLPAGRYRATLSGRRSGRPFETALEYDVR